MGDGEFNWRFVFSRIQVTKGVPIDCFLHLSIWDTWQRLGNHMETEQQKIGGHDDASSLKDDENIMEHGLVNATNL